MTRTSSQFNLFKHVGSCPNEWRALGYGFIELVQKFLTCHFIILATQDWYMISIGLNNFGKDYITIFVGVSQFSCSSLLTFYALYFSQSFSHSNTKLQPIPFIILRQCIVCHFIGIRQAIHSNVIKPILVHDFKHNIFKHLGQNHINM